MEKLINKVVPGVLITDINKDRKPSEERFYFGFWLYADDQLSYVFGLPKEGYYMFTDNEFNRYIKKPFNAGPKSLFTLGKLNTFFLSKPTILVKLSYEGEDKLVRIPMNLLKRTLARTNRNPEDVKEPGIINKIVKSIVKKLK